MMGSLQPERLDRRITIERATVTYDQFNAPIETWTPLATVWAEYKPNRGGERFQAQEVMGRMPATFRIRYRADVTVTDRLVYEGRIWNILDVREVGRRMLSEMDAVARAE